MFQWLKEFYKRHIPISNILIGDKMTLCSHEEYFALGFLSASFIFAIMTLFEDALKEVIEKIKSLIP